MRWDSCLFVDGRVDGVVEVVLVVVVAVVCAVAVVSRDRMVDVVVVVWVVEIAVVVDAKEAHVCVVALDGFVAAGWVSFVREQPLSNSNPIQVTAIKRLVILCMVSPPLGRFHYTSLSSLCQ